MFLANQEKLQGGMPAAGPSNAYPPPHNAYPPSSSAYPPPPGAYPPPSAYPPQQDPYQPAQGVPVQGYPVGYAQQGGTPAGYPGGAPAGPPGTLYMTAPPMADDGRAGPIVCVAAVLFIIGEDTARQSAANITIQQQHEPVPDAVQVYTCCVACAWIC
jgi:hypothetical protein